MRTSLKYALILIGFLAALAGASLSLAFVYRNELIKAILASVAQNNHVVFETKDVNLVLSSNLKNTKLVFKNVEVKSIDNTLSIGNFSGQTMALGVEVDLLSFLLHREVRVEKISVSNGNFLLLPGDKNAPQEQKFFELENLLQNIKQLSVENFKVYVRKDKSLSKITLNKVALQLSQNSEGVNTKLKTNLMLELMNAQAQPTLPPMHFALETSGIYSQGLIKLNTGKLGVDGLRLSASGELALQPFGKGSFNISAKGLNVEKTLPLVRRYAALKKLESASGKLDVLANISGDFSGKGKIKISATSSVLHGHAQLQNAELLTIHNLNYSLQSSKINSLNSYSCNVQEARVEYSGFELGGDATLSNFATPNYDANITFSGDVKTLKLEALPEGRVMGSASLKAANWSYEGVEKMQVLAEVSKLRAEVLKESYIIDGDFFADKESLAPRIKIESNIVSGEFDGKVQNYLPYLFDSKKACEIKITGALNANKLDLDKLFLQESDEKNMLTVRAIIEARAKEMRLFNENCLNSSAKVVYNSTNIGIDKLKTSVYGGVLNGDLKIYTPKSRSKKLNMDMYFNDIKIDKLTYLHQIFQLKNGSIQGSCDGAISLNSNFNEKGLDLQRAFGTVNLTVQNGRLLEFEPIQPLSKYIKKQLLQDVKFSALRNTVSIENGTIIIPRMEIRSSALNAYVSGKQMLNGDCDYHLTLFVSELLRQKNRNFENPIHDDKTKIFLRYTGKNGKRNVSLDTQEWGNSFTKKMQREASEIESARSKENASAQKKEEKMSFEWEEQPLENKQHEPTKKEEKKKSAPTKSEVEIEWDE